jgi:D-alanine-D-alanine ligase
MKKNLKIAVLLGGVSTERAISVASGAQVVLALRGLGHHVISVDPAVGVLDQKSEVEYFSGVIGPVAPGADSLQASNNRIVDILRSPDLAGVDVYFVALHGGAGENGSLQAMLEMYGLCYTGSDHLGSAMAMNKDISKRLFIEAGIRTPAWLMAPAPKDEVSRKIGYPLVVKPCSQGSTVGLSIVKSEADLGAAIELANQYDTEVMIEKFVAGRELTVGVVDGIALTVGEIVLGESGIFDYEAKYQGSTSEVFPADVLDNVSDKAKQLAVRAHKALKLSDYSRADFRLDSSNTLWCLEVNTLPGMTKTSLLPQSAAASGLKFDELCETICYLAMK